MLFIDNFSRKESNFSSRKQKSKAFVIFKNFKALVEKESDYVIKALRSNRGGKFTSKNFNEFYENNGIHHPIMVPRTTQQNGLVKREKIKLLLI